MATNPTPYEVLTTYLVLMGPLLVVLVAVAVHALVFRRRVHRDHPANHDGDEGLAVLDPREYELLASWATPRARFTAALLARNSLKPQPRKEN